MDDLHRDFNYSYWESDQYFKRFDLVVIGSGIVGLSAALSFLEKHRKSKVLILERGFLPAGASTRNAGFACFGSAGELLDDLERQSPETVWETVSMRWDGLKLLRKRLGDKNIAYREYGGYELFSDNVEFGRVQEQLSQLNKRVEETIGLADCYAVRPDIVPVFGETHGAIMNKYEGQLDTGLMMRQLLQLVQKKGGIVLNCVTVKELQSQAADVKIETNRGVFTAGAVIAAVNGFASQLLGMNEVKPARAQVLITGPVKNLGFRGCFHFDKGYYYFRNVGNRVLFGGGRNTDFSGETTTEISLSEEIQQRLDLLLRNKILPGKQFSVASRWAGIMGVGEEKKPIIRELMPGVIAVVRMGGMGIAIGSLAGDKAVNLVT